MFKLYDNPTGYSNIQYWKDENGMDWYEYADNASLDTMKVLVNEKNVVVGFDIDATTLSPNNTNLYEVKFEDLPDDLALVVYSYDGSTFYKTPIPKKAESVEDIKTKLLLLMLIPSLTEDERTEMEELRIRLQKLVNEK